MKIPLFSRLVPKIGVDFGSSMIRICTDRTIVSEQPSCLAVNAKTKEVVAIGVDALNLQGRVEGNITVHWPIQNGVVYDPALAVALLKIVLQPLLRASFLYQPVVMVSVAASSTPVERESMSGLLYTLGAKEVYTIAEPLAASIGAGVPIADASGCFLLQIGDQVVEAGVTALGSLVRHEKSEYGGAFLAKQITTNLYKSYGFKIGISQAKKLLEQVASVYPESNRYLSVTGKDGKQGNPVELKITAAKLVDSVLPTVEKYHKLLQQLLAKIPPELTVDILDKGLLLSGGVAQLHGLDRYLLQTLNMPVALVDSPERSVILGIQTALQHLDEYTQSLGYVNE
ncbi:rod shape-determining protein [Candidatus Woesebacteria bacterium]|nr:rod shape-determining protein [Candidatus Woesebacteria bacterium]